MTDMTAQGTNYARIILQDAQTRLRATLRSAKRGSRSTNRNRWQMDKDAEEFATAFIAESNRMLAL